MQSHQVEDFATRLHNARLNRVEIGKLSDEVGSLSIENAYAVQAQGMHLRTQLGEKKVGYKMGLTSKAKMEQMNLHQPIYGVLTHAMQIAPPESHNWFGGLIHPKAEPEIAFELKSDLPLSPSIDQIQSAIGWVIPAIEILDSRFVGFKYFSLEDVIADNASSAYFQLGEPIAYSDVDLKSVSVQFFVNGEEKASAPSSVVLGDPLESVRFLGELLAQRNETLKAGEIVLTGAMTPAAALEPGMEIFADFVGLGKLTLCVPKGVVQ